LTPNSCGAFEFNFNPVNIFKLVLFIEIFGEFENSEIADEGGFRDVLFFHWDLVERGINV
jgi:hypothetical protein